MLSWWQWTLLGLLIVAGVVLQIMLQYWINLRALDRGFGRGRSGADWAARGMTGAYTYSLLTPELEESEAQKDVESMPCPKCNEKRRVFDGYCTVCGTNIIQALIDESQEGRVQAD